MAIRNTSGLTINKGDALVTRAQFEDFTSLNYEIKFEIANDKYLVRERITVEPSKLAIAMIHRNMSNDQRVSAIESLQPIRTYLIVQAGSEATKGFKVNTSPLINWVQSMGVERIDLRENKADLMKVSAMFEALPYPIRQTLISENKPIVVDEYLVVSPHSIFGTYKVENV